MLLYASKYDDVKLVVNISGRCDLKIGVEERLGKGYMKRIKKNYRAKKLFVCGIGLDEYTGFKLVKLLRKYGDFLKAVHEGTTDVKDSKFIILVSEILIYKMFYSGF